MLSVAEVAMKLLVLISGGGKSPPDELFIDGLFTISDSSCFGFFEFCI